MKDETEATRRPRPDRYAKRCARAASVADLVSR